MSKYLGPIYKKSRRWNFSILEDNREFKRVRQPTKTVWKKRKTEFGYQLEEKQKLRFRYLLTEKQLRNTFKRIVKKKGVKSDNLFIELEKRLDNVVFRLGLAKTRKAARQLVNHGHILVNNRKNDIPSLIIKKNDLITLKKTKLKTKIEASQKKQKQVQPFSFLEWDQLNLVGKLVAEPNLKEINLGVNGTLVVEYYNRFI